MSDFYTLGLFQLVFSLRGASMAQIQILDERLCFLVWDKFVLRRKSPEAVDKRQVWFPFKAVVLHPDDILLLKRMVEEAFRYNTYNTSCTSAVQLARLAGLEWDRDNYPGLGEKVFYYATYAWSVRCAFNAEQTVALIHSDLKDDPNCVPGAVERAVRSAIAWRKDSDTLYHRYQAATHMSRCTTFQRKSPEMCVALVNALRTDVSYKEFAERMARTFPRLPLETIQGGAADSENTFLAKYICLLYARLRSTGKGFNMVPACMNTIEKPRLNGKQWKHTDSVLIIYNALMAYTEEMRVRAVTAKRGVESKMKKRKLSYIKEETTAISLKDLRGDFETWLQDKGMDAAITIMNTSRAFVRVGRRSGTDPGLWPFFKYLVWNYMTFPVRTGHFNRGVAKLLRSRPYDNRPGKLQIAKKQKQKENDTK